jgi:hypothetical protein
VIRHFQLCMSYAVRGISDGIISRARMTVLADHGAPLGVSIWREFNSAATARADMPEGMAPGRTGCGAPGLRTVPAELRSAPVERTRSDFPV